tara:strand:- start:176009 stop:177136 length:1128 start_codon:yes stop_codon:yes gene_type:complete
MKRVLTKSSDGRWRKQIDGKMRYFGSVDPKSVNRSYKDAELRYLNFLAEREVKQPIEIKVAKLTVEEFGEKYLQNCFTRYERGDISATWFEKIRISVCHFIEYLQTDLPLSKLCEMHLDDYRNHTLALPISTSTNKSISLWTAKSRLDIVKLMIKWGYQMALIETLPRNLDQYSRITIPEPTVNRFSREEIHTLYSAASERTKMFMLLGLNCGMGQADISDLRVGEVAIEESRIVRKRTKTGVHSEFALWPRTVEMLKLHGNLDGEPTDRVFLSKSGHPLVREYFVDDKFKRTDAIRSAFFRLMKKTKLPNHRGFYSLRKTAASEIEAIDPAVTEMFLAHSEKGMKRHYAERDWNRLGSAIMELQKASFPSFNLL